jgi:hypothetical protein
MGARKRWAVCERRPHPLEPARDLWMPLGRREAFVDWYKAQDRAKRLSQLRRARFAVVDLARGELLAVVVEWDRRARRAWYEYAA